MRRFIALTFFILISFGTFSQEMITDRPDQTELVITSNYACQALCATVIRRQIL